MIRKRLSQAWRRCRDDLLRILRLSMRRTIPARAATSPVSVAVPRHPGRAGTGMPPLHWSACHPATMRRFKAEMTCSAGHALVLKGHAIAADGRVTPSVVCTHADCDFHEIVSLRDWTSGDLA